jgi:hypothetical protein
VLCDALLHMCRAELEAASQAAAGELEGCQQQAAEQAAAAAAAAAHEALARAQQAAAQAAAACECLVHRLGCCSRRGPCPAFAVAAAHGSQPPLLTQRTDDARLAALESDRLSAVMRAEAAEGAALAAQNELVDVTKRCVGSVCVPQAGPAEPRGAISLRCAGEPPLCCFTAVPHVQTTTRYARELAQLKTRLAEKDAQLLGGFDIAHLMLEELAPPPSLPTLAAGPSAAFGCGRGAAAVPGHPAAAAGSSSKHLPGLRHTATAEVAGAARNSRPPSGAGGSPVAVARQSSGSHYQQQQQQQCTPPAWQPRAGGAEAWLSHQGSGRQPGGAGVSSGSKPGSPLLPSAVQQRQQQPPQGPAPQVAGEDDDEEGDEDEEGERGCSWQVPLRACACQRAQSGADPANVRVCLAALQMRMRMMRTTAGRRRRMLIMRAVRLLHARLLQQPQAREWARQLAGSTARNTPTAAAAKPQKGPGWVLLPQRLVAR